MEQIFEIQYTESQAFLKKVCRQYARVRRAILIPIFGMFSLLFLLVGITQQKSVLILLSIVYILLTLREIMLPSLVAAKSYKKKLRFYDNENPVLTVRCAEAIEVSDIDSYCKYPYNKIKKINVKDRIIFLHFQDGKSLAFPAENFTVGTYSEFLKYLREKCSRTQIPDWEW